MPRRLFRFMAAHHYEVRRWLAVDVTGVPLGGLVARPSLQARAFARAVGADEAAVRADLAALGGHLAEVERLRAEGVLGGDEPNAADFQIADLPAEHRQARRPGAVPARAPGAVRWAQGARPRPARSHAYACCRRGGWRARLDQVAELAQEALVLATASRR